MKLTLILCSLVFFTILSLGPDIIPIPKAFALPVGLNSDSSLESSRLIAKLKSQKSFSISLKNRTFKSALKELNSSLDIKFDTERQEDDFTFTFDFDIKEMNALEALDQLLAFRGMYGSFENGSLRIYFGYRC